MWRHNPQTARLKALVDEGAIGELRVVRSTFSYSLYDETNSRLRTDADGGALMDVGCYTISGSRFLAGGEPERVFGEAWFGPSGTDWVFAGSMRFPGNVIASFDCGTALPNRDEL
jgi:predicted dehydrogenase